MFVRLRISLAVLVLCLPLSAQAAALHIRHWTLTNGARVYFVSAHELPMVQINVAFDAGSARDTPRLSGLASLTGQMLTQGAGVQDATQLATALEQRGAELSVDTGRDMTTISFRSLSDRHLLQPAAMTLAQILARPSFPARSLERVRGQALVGLKAEQQDPGAVASRAFYRAIYRDHPYGLYPSGSAMGLKAVTRADLIAFHHRYYVASNAVIAIVGDLSTPRARALSEELTRWLPRGQSAPVLPPVPSVTRVTDRVAFPSTQTHILIGEPGEARSDPDYFPLLVGNYTLGGGGLVSRLMEEIREKRGLAYTAYSEFDPLESKGPFIMGVQTRNAKREEVDRLMRSTLDDFVKTGPTEAELHAAKEFLTGSFPLRIDSDQKIAENLVVIGFYRLPLTYLDDFTANVQAVTLEQIRAAFRRHLDPARMVTVMVGGEAQ